jgi:hypothetical protein
MNFLPPGPQEAYVPVGTAFGSTESSWPLTPESLKRMNKNGLVGETYDKLDKALIRLSDEEPELYEVMLKIYLREESGHRDLDHLIKHNKWSLVHKHDAAVGKLVEYLDEAELFVRWPQKAAGPKPGQDMQERHDELYRIFESYYNEQGMPYRQALTNAVFSMQDHEGNSYYSRRHADRIVKSRMNDGEE